MYTQLRALPASAWVRVVPYALLAGLVIGVPSDLINTRLFGRPVPVRAIDWLILVVSAFLIGLVFAIRPETADLAIAEEVEKEGTRTIWGGFVSFLAVGCPVCNQAVVALVGTSGALSWWAPVQPIVGALAVGVLLYTLRLRLRSYGLTACPVPALHA